MWWSSIRETNLINGLAKLISPPQYCSAVFHKLFLPGLEVEVVTLDVLVTDTHYFLVLSLGICKTLAMKTGLAKRRVVIECDN